MENINADITTFSIILTYNGDIFSTFYGVGSSKNIEDQ